MSPYNYTRLELVQGLRDHFGLQDTTDINDLLVRSLDEAVGEVVRKRRSWHFLEKPLTVDVGVSKTGTALFTQGSANAALVTGTAPAPFEIIADSETTNIVEGFRVVSYSTPNITLDAKYVPATGTKNFVAAQGWFLLPADFVSMDGPLWDVQDLDTRLQYKSPPTFENIVRSKAGSVGRPSFYTVVPDPRAADEITSGDDPASYLVMFPYMVSRTTLRGKYQAHPDKLEFDTSIPIVPREYRPVLLDWARWSASVRLRMEATIIQSYLIQARESITDMLKEFEYSDDVDDSVSPTTNIDLPIEGLPSQGDMFSDFS